MTKKNKESAIRKTPRQERSSTTFNHIIEATALVIESKGGLKELNTTMVAKLAGYGIGTLYQYFPNKSALIAALIERAAVEEFELLKATIEEAEKDNRSLGDILQEIIEALFEFHGENPKMHKVVGEEIHRLKLDEKIHVLEARAIEVIRDLLVRHKAELKDTEDTALDHMAFIIVYSVEMIIRSTLSVKAENIDDPQFVGQMVRMIRGYLKV